jgi:hypothetical protein
MYNEIKKQKQAPLKGATRWTPNEAGLNDL